MPYYKGLVKSLWILKGFFCMNIVGPVRRCACENGSVGLCVSKCSQCVWERICGSLCVSLCVNGSIWHSMPARWSVGWSVGLCVSRCSQCVWEWICLTFQAGEVMEVLPIQCNDDHILKCCLQYISKRKLVAFFLFLHYILHTNVGVHVCGSPCQRRRRKSKNIFHLIIAIIIICNTYSA